LLVAARQRAIEDAKARAQQLTEGFGVCLEEVISIDESATGGPRPTLDVVRFAEVATPIAPGEEEVVVQVTVEYEISGQK
ncbi:MAG: SIMPL domain-containing protein, partial [Actinomycetota bacterium]